MRMSIWVFLPIWEASLALLLPDIMKVTEPAVIEIYGAAEVYCDGTIAVPDGEVVHILVYVERRSGDLIERHEIARFCMSRARHEANLLRAFERYRGAAGH